MDGSQSPPLQFQLVHLHFGLTWQIYDAVGKLGLFGNSVANQIQEDLQSKLKAEDISENLVCIKKYAFTQKSRCEWQSEETAWLLLIESKEGGNLPKHSKTATSDSFQISGNW